MKIQFVCQGNTYRSRIAEAYLKSKRISGVTVSSSGIEAAKDLSGPIASYTKDILEKERVYSFAKKNWTQTSKTELGAQDIVIFMLQSHLEFCKNKLHFTPKKYEVWGINDVTDVLTEAEMADNKKVADFAEKNYSIIMKKVDNLVKRIH